MKSINKKYKITVSCLFFAVLLSVCLSACKKNVITALPDNKEAIELNFYPASDVLNAYLSNAYTGIYVDHFIPRLSSSIPPAAFFYFRANGTSDEFPVAFTHTGGSGSGTVVTYAAYNAGAHRLMFTDTTNNIVLDTAFNQPALSHTCIYFTDALTAVNAPPAYKMLAVQEDRSGIAPDKVGVRFVHLSADAGPLVVNLQKSDGSLTNALPADLHFDEASPYRYYVAADTVAGLLRFNLNNPANGAKVITGVPYNPGKDYVVVIAGFYNDQKRQISIGKNLDGSINYKSITINRNLHSSLRRIY